MLRLIALLGLVACNGDRGETPTDSGTPPPVCDVSWEQFVEPTLRNWCVPCHSVNVPEVDRRGAPLGVDFDTWEQSHAWADRIAVRVLDEARPMPPAGGLADWEREDLARWAACGADGTPAPVDPCDAPIERAGDATGADALCALGDGVAVTGDLVLSADPGDALDCLCRVDGALSIDGPTAVRLPRLEQVGGAISGVGPLASLVLPELRSAGAVSLSGAPLAEVDLDHLGAVAGGFEVVGGALPATFGPAWLADVGGPLRIEGAAGVEVLDLPRLERVGGELRVAGNPALTRILHTSDLEVVEGALRILDNPSLSAIEDFTFLDRIGGDLEIGGNAIASYAGFYLLTAVGGSVVLRDDLTPSELDLFRELVTIGGTLSLRGLGATAVDGFDALDEVGGIEVVDNPGLGTWRAGSARAVLGDAVVRGNPNLQAAPFLRDVQAVGGALTFQDLPKVAQIPLVDLRTVGGALTVQSLRQLEELDGLHGITAVGGDLVLRNNPRLSQAEIDALLAAWGPGVVAGDLIVQGNGP